MADKYVQQIEFKAKIDQLEKQMNKAGKAGKKMSGAFLAAGAAVTALVAIGKKATDAYAAQEKAERMLSAAVKGNTDSLKQYAAELQQTTVHGDEATIQQMSFLASLEFTEDQIKKVIPVAMDLASATGMSLESAVRNTAKTFSGLSGELGELVPQLRNLTAEQLKAGEGVEVMGELFMGQADAEGDTFAGALTQFSNIFGDFLEDVGEGIAPFVMNMAGGFASIVRSSKELIKNSPADEFEKQTKVLEASVASLSFYDKNSQVRTEIIKNLKKEYPDFNKMVGGEYNNLELVNRQLSLYVEHAESKLKLMREEMTNKGIQEALGGAYKKQAEGIVAMTSSWDTYGAFIEKTLRSELKGALSEGQIQLEDYNKAIGDLDLAQGKDDIGVMLDLLEEYPNLTSGMIDATSSFQGQIDAMRSSGTTVFDEFLGALGGVGARLQVMEATDIDDSITRVLHGFELLAASGFVLHDQQDAITIALNQSTKALTEHEQQVQKEAEALRQAGLIKEYFAAVESGEVLDESTLENLELYRSELEKSEASLDQVIGAFQTGGELAGPLVMAQQWEEGNRKLEAANTTFLGIKSKTLDSIDLEVQKKQEQIAQLDLIVKQEVDMEEKKAEAIRLIREQLNADIKALNQKKEENETRSFRAIMVSMSSYSSAVGNIFGSLDSHFGANAATSKKSALAQIAMQEGMAIANFATGASAAFSKGPTPLAFLEAAALGIQMVTTLQQLKDAKAMAKTADYGSAQTGGSFIAEDPMMLMVGEEGAENIEVTPLDDPTAGGGGGAGGTIVFNNPILTEEIIESEIIPKIQQAIDRGETIKI